MKSCKKFLILITTLFLITSIGFAQSQDSYSLVKTGDKVPSFIVKTIEGKSLDVNKLKGKVVLLNFFATWCRPCMEEMPNIEKLQNRFPTTEFVIISVGREHQLAELEIFNQTKRFTFNIAADPNRKIYELFAVKMIPRNYVIDKEGTICYQCSGYNHQEFESMINVIEKEIKK